MAHYFASGRDLIGIFVISFLRFTGMWRVGIASILSLYATNNAGLAFVNFSSLVKG